MDLKFVLHLLVLTTAVELRSIEVYEDVDDTPSVPFSISSRTQEPNKNQRLTWPGTEQQDLQKWRYFQQQQVDNQTRNRLFLHKANSSNLSQSPIKKREVAVPHARRRPIVFLIPPKTRSINLGLNHAENMRIMRDIQHDEQLQALNQLIGKNPNAQLEGLQQLLGPKGYTPITEDFIDVANPQSHPNVKVEYAPQQYQEAISQEDALRAQSEEQFKAIEQQLIAASHAEAEQALAKAQKAAFAEVEAQQQAILEAQSHSTKTHDDAFAKAEAQRQATLLAHGHSGKPKHGYLPAATHQKDHPPYVASYPPYPIRQKHVEDSKKAYGGHKDDLQYASQYAFGYRVRDFHSGNDYGHEEIHDGHTAKGNYHVLLPDGRVQHVQYWADETGFHSKVTYDRVAQHPH